MFRIASDGEMLKASSVPGSPGMCRVHGMGEISCLGDPDTTKKRNDKIAHLPDSCRLS